MPDTKQHVMERRSALLAERLQQRIDDMATALQSDGRIPFRTKLPRNDALDWWAKHRYDNLGAQALAGLDPLTTSRLDNALSSYIQQQQAEGMPVEANSQPENES